jgi:soluble lytic murein transglycosylase
MALNRAASVSERFPGAWSNLRGGVLRLAAGLLVLAVLPAPAQDGALERLARAYRATPNARTRAALETYATANTRRLEGALAHFALAAATHEDGDGRYALGHLAALGTRLAALSDYVNFLNASVRFQAKDYSRAAEAGESVLKTSLASPLAGRAAVVVAKAALEAGQPARALAALSAVGAQLPQPQGALLTGQANEAAGGLAAAAAAYQTVWVDHPAAKEAAEARDALARLRRALGARYPELAPQARLARGEQLIAAREYAAAKEEFEAAARELAGAPAELARVRAAAADYHARKPEVAARALRGMQLEDAEAGAERLYYLTAAARRLEDEAGVGAALGGLARHHSSPWRLKALTLAASLYLVRNEPAGFLPLYSACAATFEGEAEAALCDWRVAWRAWLDRKPEAPARLLAHLTRYPNSEKAAAALYWLARNAEESGDAASARRLYEAIANSYPNQYYEVLARERLAAAPARPAPAPRAEEILRQVRLPERLEAPTFTLPASGQVRLERARLLERAGLDHWADAEMRFGARQDRAPWSYALALAGLVSQRGDPHIALRHIKGVAPRYLLLAPGQAPEKFWQLAFPFPYRSLIETYARQRGIDRFLLAALIRQESEFDPQVVSSANAVGLTQVVPATGRQLSRRAGVSGFRAAMLKQAEPNLKIGTYYFANLLASFGGSVEAALAGYNAGPSRPAKWRQWAEFREPAEFVETIPFQQTRDYVQIVLRNADIYRRLYGRQPPAPTAPKAAPKSDAKSKPAAKRKR